MNIPDKVLLENNYSPITVKELIEYLQQCPQDMIVCGTWEGVIRDIRGIEIYTWKKHGELRTNVLLDVE